MAGDVPRRPWGPGMRFWRDESGAFVFVVAVIFLSLENDVFQRLLLCWQLRQLVGGVTMSLHIFCKRASHSLRIE